MSQTYRMSLRASRTNSTVPHLIKDVETVERPRSIPTRPPPLPHPAGHSSATTNSGSSASQVRSLGVDHPEYVPPLLAGIRVHLLPTKLDAALPEYSRKVVTLGGKLVPLPTAMASVTGEKPIHQEKTTFPLDYPHVVLTALKGRPRLSRLLIGNLVDDLDVVDIVWIDEVWKTAQDWVWGRPISVGLGADMQDHEAPTNDEGITESQMNTSTDTGFAQLQSSSFPLPELPDRHPFRIPNTSATILERIRNRDSLAVCEASDVAICLKETLGRDSVKMEFELEEERLDLGMGAAGKRKRDSVDGDEEKNMGIEKKIKREASTMASANDREDAGKRRPDVQSLTRGFSTQALDLRSGVPGYLAHLQNEDSIKTESILNLNPPQRAVITSNSDANDTETQPPEFDQKPSKEYMRMGKKVSIHVNHPKQDKQILAKSKEEQVVEKPEIIDGVETLRPLPYDVELEEIPSLAIRRCSPLICVNDDIINAIRPIYLKREFDAPAEKNANTLSYKRSMSASRLVLLPISCLDPYRIMHLTDSQRWFRSGLVFHSMDIEHIRNLACFLTAVPRRLKSGAEALKLSGCGSKVADRITEYLETGRIEESDNILTDPRFRTLREFSSVFTIGTSTAVELYDTHGCRSLSDVADYYAEKEGQEWDSGVVGEGVPLAKRKVRYGTDGVLGGRGGTYRWKRKTRDAVRRRQEGMMSKAEICREWMLIQDELDERIPRAEVQEIARCVQTHLDAILPGCHCTLTGGYRRGKLESGDIDLIICPPAPGLDSGLLKSLRDRMTAAGIITHILQLTMAVDLERQTHNNARGNNFDGLDKAFVIFKLPSNHTRRPRLHRRVDLIVAPYHRYSLAVLGWSGSMIFERDLRRHAEDALGLKFDSGSLHVRQTGEELYARTERDVFRLLRLDWVPPEFRNADG
ncbi:hypothetical protein HD553DRAFT_122785 [Filobasidium floriforme]|uniref:uncharacterized protein n=1 Tax=Filobasidium floriforme TaxID=5210 RepID=UPI001E8CFFC6|nr:uncharacterized protein HD553DRAFT_122785 [Filobasidium floriforme]KAH8080217.1 hypothetical protein HD553DRAFT_122785 [Filobasidium floriforme]